MAKHHSPLEHTEALKFHLDALTVHLGQHLLLTTSSDRNYPILLYPILLCSLSLSLSLQGFTVRKQFPWQGKHRALFHTPPSPLFHAHGTIQSFQIHKTLFRFFLGLGAGRFDKSPAWIGMDHNSMNQHQHHLGVNKLGKNIRKSPLHQPNFQKLPPAALNQQQSAPPPQPRVYNINKSDFRSVVQQLTGSPARDASGGYPPAPARPPQPKHPSSRLMKIRPPPLTPIARPQPPPFQNQLQISNTNLNPNPAYHRPAPAPSPSATGSTAWTESVSAYMRYLESSLLTSDSSRQPQQQQQQQLRAQGLLPFPHPAATAAGAFPSPRGNPPSSALPPSQPALLPSPGLQFPLLSPGSQFPLPSLGASVPLPSPNSQFPLPSPSLFLNLFSPKSPYPLLSPRFQYPMPLTPNFSYSPLPQSGILGPGPGFQPLPSPSLLFPPSPSSSLPLRSPRWGEM